MCLNSSHSPQEGVKLTGPDKNVSKCMLYFRNKRCMAGLLNGSFSFFQMFIAASLLKIMA